MLPGSFVSLGGIVGSSIISTGSSTIDGFSFSSVSVCGLSATTFDGFSGLRAGGFGAGPLSLDTLLSLCLGSWKIVG